jgi:glucose/arabinose dehydrogenase
MQYWRFCFLWVLFAAFWLAACQAKEAPELTGGPMAEPVTAIALEPVVTGLNRPIAAAYAGDGQWIIAEQKGLVRVVQDGELSAEPLLDLTDSIATDGSERGLLGLTLHPDFATNGWFYVVYTNLDGDTEIVRYTVSAERMRSPVEANPMLADPASAVEILFVEQPYGNHNGGELLFGPDGYLYIGLGDGGAVGDPFDNAQDAGTLLGSILRLDVDNATPYAIPADNPFVDDAKARGEVWATGLRNPWSVSFDRERGDLYIADVGQEGPEEINFQPEGRSGINYGWPIMEGSRCFEDETCNTNGTQLPIFEYPHSEGCAVVGGSVYRGMDFPALNGNYFFADYCLGTIWTLRYDAAKMDWERTLVYEAATTLSNFAEDSAGELYALAYNTGVLYQITAANLEDGQS